MASPTTIVDLAKKILSHAEALEELNSTDSPLTSNSMLQSANVSEAMRVARREILDAAYEVQVAVTGPSEFVEQQQIHFQIPACFRWLLEFDIFSHMPRDSEQITYADLASRANVSPSRLRSVARMAMTSGLFIEPTPTTIAHTTLSRSFASEPLLQDYAQFMIKYGAPLADAFPEATRRWGDSTASNETAFNIAYRTEMSFFQHVKTNPDMGKEFAKFMRGQSRSESGNVAHILAGFDWQALGDGVHVVDVGGSTGHVCIALASAHPGFTFTVQDLPEVIDSCASTLKELPTSIATRISFVAHDFFTAQPANKIPPSTKTVVYLLRKVLHDWVDERSRIILSRLSVALQLSNLPSARIIIMDTILPPPGTLSKLQEAALRVRDLSMAQSFNNKERELGEWEELLASATPKLTLRSWKQPPGSAMAVMDVGLAE